ncbi:hypothetical protein KN1_08160 [Stygiolobus caldivivus]|uniref:Uncharacterized protein n=1 Tax=Stygiolobus caldivivus TaxID=2824673 RepID=A0A8D5U625_9CREN|nr:hypothetical protein KN1_08160 [Stygiolobus caldivivus]
MISLFIYILSLIIFIPFIIANECRDLTLVHLSSLRIGGSLNLFELNYTSLITVHSASF